MSWSDHSCWCSCTRPQFCLWHSHIGLGVRGTNDESPPPAGLPGTLSPLCCISSPALSVSTHHVTTKGLCHLVTNFELEEGSNTSTSSPGEICHSVAEALLTFLGLEHIFQWQPPQCVQLCLRSRMYWISFFTGPGSAIFLGHPSTNSVWSSAVIQQPQNRRQRFSWERPKRSKMSHQMSPKVPGEAGGKLRVAVWAFPESSSSHGAHSAVGHWHALKWLGWSPGITVGCRPPPSGASSLPAEEGAVARWPQPAPASGARPGPEVCSAVASAPLLAPCVWPPASTRAIEPAVQAMGLTWPPRRQQSHKPHLCHDLLPL